MNTGTQPYLLVEDIGRLRRKLNNSRHPLDRWWPHFRELAQHQSHSFPFFSALVYLVTGQRAFAELAKAHMLARLRQLPALEYSVHTQFHTWCQAHPLARLAILYDWVADSGVFTHAEQMEIRERLVDFAWKHPYLVAQSRVPGAENQIMSMLFCCAVVGYLFGEKHASDARARELFAYGVGRFPELVGLAQVGGYSLEGSTYMHQVYAPAATFWAAFMESLTGEDHFRRRYPPNNTCLREVLEMDARMIGPDGLLPPWDHYGFQRATNKSGLAYLARKTGNHAWLTIPLALDLWSEADEIAWGSDDKLWTLLWWPDDAMIPENVAAFPSWLEPNTAAALDAPAKQMRWFQYWDGCGADYHVGRTQVNPNASILSAFGSPFLLDGTPTEECRHFAFPLERAAPFMTAEQLDGALQLYKEIRYEQTVESWLRAWTYGCLGGSNSIVVDGESWYTPREPKSCTTSAFAVTPLLKAVQNDAAAFYQPYYDVTQMRRASVLVRDSYVITQDTIAARSKHRWTWQVYARPGVRAVGAGFQIHTPEQTCCAVIPAKPYPHTLQHVPGYISVLEGAADLLQFHQEGTEARFACCLWPSMKLALIADLTEGWQAGTASDGETDARWQREAIPGEQVGFGDIGFFAPGAPVDCWRWLQRTVDRPPGDRIFLRIERAAPNTCVWVNGREISTPKHDGLVPLVVDITATLRDGQNLVVLATKPARGKAISGTVGLYGGIESPTSPQLEEVAPNCFAVTAEGRRDFVLLDNNSPYCAEGWNTDAWCALLDASEGAALQATYCRGEQFAFHGTKADIAWSADGVHCGDLSGKADLWCQWEHGHVHVEAGGVIRISGSGQLSVSWNSERSKPVFVSGVPAQPDHDAFSRRYSVVIATVPETNIEGEGLAHRWNRAVALAHERGEQTRRELEPLLLDRCWQVRCAAALGLGARREKDSVPALIAALKDDIQRDNYPPLAQNEDASDLNHSPNDFADNAAQETFVKRWRFALCCTTALGKIGDPLAVPLLCEILDRKQDFYPLLASTAEALGKIGDPVALPSLLSCADYFETNTRMRAREAIPMLRKA